jgi:hypothetical protein
VGVGSHQPDDVVIEELGYCGARAQDTCLYAKIAEAFAPTPVTSVGSPPNVSAPKRWPPPDQRKRVNEN